MWKRLIASGLCFVGITVQLFGADALWYDLDHDGIRERIEWQPYERTPEGTYYRLVVFKGKRLIWSSPLPVTNENSPFFIASTHMGESFPEAIWDTDENGKPEVLIPEMQSDVSPTLYRRLEWRYFRFVPLQPAYLEFYGGSHHGTVDWTTKLRRDKNHPAWISNLRDQQNGEYLGLLTYFAYGLDRGPISRDVVIQPYQNGGIVIDYNGAVSSRSNESFPPSHGGWQSGPTDHQSAAQAYRNDSIDSAGWKRQPSYPGSTIRYIARLSRRDHLNSRGIPLSSVKAILRQDRANYYLYGGDREDRSDGYFNTSVHRNAIETMQIRPVNVSYRRLRESIVYGEPLVRVTVNDDTLFVELLRY